MIIQVNRPIWWNQTFIYTIILCICCYWQKVRPLQIFEKYIPPVGTLVECTLRLAEWYHYFLCDVHYSGRFLHIHCDAASAWRQTSPISWSGVSSPSPQRQSLSWSSIYIYGDFPAKSLQPTSTGKHQTRWYIVFFLSTASSIRSSHGTVSSTMNLFTMSASGLW